MNLRRKTKAIYAVRADLDWFESVIGPVSTSASSRGCSVAKSLAVMAELSPDAFADVRHSGSLAASVATSAEAGTRMPTLSTPGFTWSGSHAGRRTQIVTGPGNSASNTDTESSSGIHERNWLTLPKQIATGFDADRL